MTPPALTAKPLVVLEPHHVDHVFAAWYVQDRRSSILLAVDVSGSMQQPAPGTGTPLIQLVRQGCLAVGQMLPDQSALGLWAFGSQLDPPRDYTVLLPTAPLTEGQRAALSGAVGRLAAEQTGTGLYDTILAAYRSATSSYRQGEGNQVVIFTDGRNEDDAVSIDAAQLSAGLKAAADPKRPVELTVVAFGKLPDVSGLQTVIGAVNGYVSAVQTPEEVSAGVPARRGQRPARLTGRAADRRARFQRARAVLRGARFRGARGSRGARVSRGARRRSWPAR